jgi:uncharacterized membrane protein YdfJ with MMPL/SSD domain
MAVPILLDVLLIRLILVPALMELMGGLNWYLPSGWTGCCRGSTSKAG